MAHVYLDENNERSIDTMQQIKDVQQEMQQRELSSLPVYVGDGQDEYKNGQILHAMSRASFETETSANK